MSKVIEKIKEFEQKAIDSLGCIDVEGLISSFGIEFDAEAVLPEGISGQIEKLPDGRYKISANHKENIKRRRFTAVHELGHYIYHRSLLGDGVDDNKAYRSVPDGNFYNKSIGVKEETEANQFAASVLMPWDLLEALRIEYTKTIKDNDERANKIAETLQVSREAFGYRVGI